MTRFETASRQDNEEVLDFINYVFSHDHKPHDFKELMPKVYGNTNNELGATHYVMREDGKIRALTGIRSLPISIGNLSLNFGLIGSVAVHPYSRGNGYMKSLMNHTIEEAKSQKFDLLALGGQRQRYGYFGFEPAGFKFSFQVNSKNIQHCLGNIDCSTFSFSALSNTDEKTLDNLISLYESRPFHSNRNKSEFVEIMKTWNLPCWTIIKNNKVVGYCYGYCHEVVLEEESDFLPMLKAFFEQMKIPGVSIPVYPFETDRINALNDICENVSLEHVEMISVLNWENVLQAFLNLKASYSTLEDGIADFVIEEKGYRISVSNGIPTVSTVIPNECAKKLSHNEAEKFFFGFTSCLIPDKSTKNWMPLPFCIDMPDSF